MNKIIGTFVTVVTAAVLVSCAEQKGTDDIAMEEAALADRIVVLNRGMVAGEGGKEIFADRALIENAGLELPLSARVAADLRERGLALDGNVTLPEELINALCR